MNEKYKVLKQWLNYFIFHSTLTLLDTTAVERSDLHELFLKCADLTKPAPVVPKTTLPKKEKLEGVRDWWNRET